MVVFEVSFQWCETVSRGSSAVRMESSCIASVRGKWRQERGTRGLDVAGQRGMHHCEAWCQVDFQSPSLIRHRLHATDKECMNPDVAAKYIKNR